jgi:hypothetical protein
MIYLLLYQVKGKALTTSTMSANDGQVVVTVQSWDETTVVEPEIELDGYDRMVASMQEATLSAMSWETNAWEAETWTFVQTATSLSWIHMLSWTKLFYGKIEAIDKLGIKYQYALIDGSWTYFINLGMQTYDFDSITRALWGNIYKITTEQELAKNKLFGNKVLYINLPEYKDLGPDEGKLVLMLEYVGKEVRLIQIEYKLYHSSKSYLKSLFVQ